MNSKFIAAALTFVPLVIQADETDYLTKIVQTNTFRDESGTLHENVKLLADLPAEGTREAAEGVMGSSLFQLIAEAKATGTEHLIDETSVSSYKADATLKIIGPQEDTYNVDLRPGEIPRTQVGQGFTVQYTVEGLLPPSSGTSEAASELSFIRRVFEFGSDQTTITDDEAYTSSSVTPLKDNGNFEKKEYTKIIVPSDQTKARGQERFFIYAKPDYKVTWDTLARADIHVWPISNGTMAGLVDGETYQAVPTVDISLIDLYPTSDTFLEITSSELEEPIIYGSRKNTNNVPISVDFSLTSLDDVLKDDGTYIIRLIHKSPFDTLEFGRAVIEIDRSIKINGQLIDSEVDTTP